MSAVSDRFNAFNLDVGCITEKMRWVLDRSESDDQEIHILRSMVEDLGDLVERQDCRDELQQPELTVLPAAP